VFRLRSNGEECAVAFSGDLGRKNLSILRDPETIPDIDYLVIESTYGDRLHEPVEKAESELAEIISHTVSRGGKVIVPGEPDAQKHLNGILEEMGYDTTIVKYGESYRLALR
jgi:Cft2 family RNA processing exonuclease